MKISTQREPRMEKVGILWAIQIYFFNYLPSLTLSLMVCTTKQKMDQRWKTMSDTFLFWGKSYFQVLFILVSGRLFFLLPGNTDLFEKIPPAV